LINSDNRWFTAFVQSHKNNPIGYKLDSLTKYQSVFNQIRGYSLNLIMKNSIQQFLVALMWVIIPISSAYSQVEGKIMDATNQLALSDVHVMLNGRLADVTDDNGAFRIPAAKTSDTLTFNRLGYKPKRLRVQEDPFINVFLQASSQSIKGIAVKALGYKSQAFRSPSAIEMISGDRLQLAAIDDPSPVFNSMPGLYAHAGAQNTHRITIRGIGARSMYSTTKMKAYLNEIPLTSGMGETTLEDLDLEMIDRITLVKGPAATIYGAALGGTILYRAGQNIDAGAKLKTQNTFGSFDLMRNSIEYSHGWKNTSLELAVNRYSKDGFRQNDDYKRQSVNILATHFVTDKTRIAYFGRFHDLKAYIPSSLDQTTFENEPENAADNWLNAKGYEKYFKWLNGFSLQHQFSSTVSSETSLFYKSYKGYERRPFNVLDDQTQTTGLRSVLNISPSWLEGNTSLNAGFETFYEDYSWKTLETLPEDNDGKTLTDNSQQRYYHNLFSTFQLAKENYTVDIGLNLNKTGYDYVDNFNDSTDYSTSHEFDWVVAPRLSVSYHPFAFMNLYGSISHGFSAPSYEEAIDSQGFANTGLKPETGWNREIGLKGDFRKTGLSFETTFFSMDVDNLLVTKRLAEDRYTKINAGETLHEGIESSLRYGLIDKINWKSTLTMSYTFSDFKFVDFKDDGNTYDGNHLPGIPEHKVFASFNLTFFKNYFLYTDVIWVDRMPMNDENSLYTDSYHRVNLKVGWRGQIGDKWKFEIYAGLRNLTQQHYASMVLVNAVGYGGSDPRYFYPAKPLNYYSGFTFSYKFNKLTKNK